MRIFFFLAPCAFPLEICPSSFGSFKLLLNSSVSRSQSPACDQTFFFPAARLLSQHSKYVLPSASHSAFQSRMEPSTANMAAKLWSGLSLQTSVLPMQLFSFPSPSKTAPPQGNCICSRLEFLGPVLVTHVLTLLLFSQRDISQDYSADILLPTAQGLSFPNGEVFCRERFCQFLGFSAASPVSRPVRG